MNIKGLFLVVFNVGMIWGIASMLEAGAPPKYESPKDPYVTDHGEVPGSYTMKGLIQQVARDPDSVEIDQCGSERTPKGYKMLCNFRARNGFGGYNRDSLWFMIDKGSVKYAGPKEPRGK